MVWAAAWPASWCAAFVVLPLLPDVLAAAGAFTLVFLVPGFAALSLAPGVWRTTETLVLAATFGMGVAAVAALPALLLRWPLVVVVLLHVVSGTLLVYFAASHRRARFEFARQPAAVVAALLAVMFIVSASLGSDLWKNVDNWHVLPYTASMFSGDDLNAEDPNVGNGVDVISRRLFNTFSVDQAILGHVSGVHITDLALNHFHLIGAFFGAVGVYALGRAFGGSERAGLFALVLYAAMTLSDLYVLEGYGLSLLLRGGEDKFFAYSVLYPGFLLVALRYDGSLGLGALTVLAALALFLMHPFGLAFVAVVMASLVLAQLCSSLPTPIGAEGYARLTPSALVNSVKGLFRPGSLTIPVGLLVVFLGAVLVGLAAFQRFFVDDFADDKFSGENQIRTVWRYTEISAGFLLLNWRMVTHPLMWLSFLVAPFVVWRLGASRLGWFVGLSLIALPVVLFFPPTATLASKLSTPGLLWRFLYIMPFAPVLGAVVAWASRRVPVQFALLVVLIVGSAVAKEGLARLDDYYRNHGSSVILAGLENVTADAVPGTGRAGGGSGLQTPEVESAVAELDAAILGDALLLVPSRVVVGNSSVQLDLALPVYAPELKSYTTAHSGDLIKHDWRPGELYEPLLQNGHIGASKRAEFSEAFYLDRFPPTIRLETMFDRKPITHVLINPTNRLVLQLSQSRYFRLAGYTSFGYSLYEVVQPLDP